MINLQLPVISCISEFGQETYTAPVFWTKWALKFPVSHLTSSDAAHMI